MMGFSNERTFNLLLSIEFIYLGIESHVDSRNVSELYGKHNSYHISMLYIILLCEKGVQHSTLEPDPAQLNLMPWVGFLWVDGVGL